ncbi:MAG TPA: AAA family ATPase, partial [Kineosporiaceae bacterium]|nr:AAA family ATPase [Kineosporiaceae bacterium]
MFVVGSHLLERQVELELLEAAVGRAARGHGSATLVSGEAGIGKTSLVRAFVSAVGRGAHVLSGAGEDLLTPRALGPLRDAARFSRGPLADALTSSADPDRIFGAARDELAASPTPTVLIVEDAHWADGATLDVVQYLGRRIQDLPAALLITYRDDDLAWDHPLRRVLGGFGGDAIRVPLAPLTVDAVRRLAAATAVDAAELFDLTGGNPFYVTEALACCDDRVPPTVVDAVLARVHRLDPLARSAVEQLAVTPAGAEPDLVRDLLGELSSVAEAERSGVLGMRDGVITFRHELARRAVLSSLPGGVRVELNARVLRALLCRADPDAFRALHHAVEAGDGEAVVRYGWLAGKEASRVGAHRQAASCFAQVLARERLLPLARRAAVGEAYSWALSNSNQLHAAAEAAATAVAQWRQVGDDARSVRALVTLSRQQWLTESAAAAQDSARQALTLADAGGDTVQKALALLNLGGLLVLLDQEQQGLPILDQALELADR